jgi:hypothetical protein
MTSFFDRLEAQLHTAAQAQTAGSWAGMRVRSSWLRTGMRMAPILAAVAVTVSVVVAFTIGSHANRVAGSHKSSTTNSTTAQPSNKPTPSPPPSGIRGRLLTNNELPSFQSVRVTVFSSLSSWLAGEQGGTPHEAAAEKAMLTHNGFRAGAREALTQGPTPGLSIVEQFQSPQAARAALAFYDALNKNDAGPAFRAFSVHGIPGAQGLTDVTNHGVNIAFSDGPYYYLVGEEGGGPAKIAALNSAALHLYHRVHS